MTEHPPIHPAIAGNLETAARLITMGEADRAAWRIADAAIELHETANAGLHLYAAGTSTAAHKIANSTIGTGRK